MNFCFDENKFDRLFPFYLLIGDGGVIISCGSSLKKLHPIKAGDLFSDHFHLIRPNVATQAGGPNELLSSLRDQLVVMAHNNDPGLKLRGQFDTYGEKQFLFVGTPWFESMAQLEEHNLFINDFALHDSIVDMLNVLQTKEITNTDFRNLLKNYNEQTRELRKRELELRNTTSRLSQLIANLENGILVEDEHRNILLINENLCKVFGIPVSPEQLVGVNCSGFAEQVKALFVDPEAFISEITMLLENREKKLDHILEMKDGRVFSRDFIPVFFGENYRGHLWKYTDITVSKTLERKLEQQKKFYENILDKIPADIAVFDSQHRYLFLNPEAIRDNEIRKWIIGKTDEEYITYRNRDISIAHGRQKLFNEIVASRQQSEWEEKSVNKEGKTEYNLRKMYPVYDEQGELKIVIGYGINITERKKIEEQVKLSEARYKGIFDHSLALICTHDVEGVLQDVNNSVMETLGYTREELIGMPIQDIIAKPYRSEFKRKYLSSILVSGKEEGVMVVEHKNGEYIYLLFQNFLLSQETGNPYIIGFAQNITDRVHAERALKASEEKYKNMIANMNLGLLEMNNSQEIMYANRSFCEMSGYVPAELTGKNFYALFLNDEYNFTDEQNPGDGHVPETRNEKRKTFYDSRALELKTTNKNGEGKWWLFSEGASFDKHGNVVGAIGIFLDITLQKKLENELIIARYKAELSAKSKEIFLANMSHEIRTPMNAVLGIGKLLQKTRLEPQQKIYLNTIQIAANNLLVILNDLLDFSKIEAGKLTLESVGFNISQLIENAVLVLKHKVEEKGLVICHELENEISPILVGDPYRINQVLMNLLGNSIKFTERGSIKVQCTLMADDDDTQVVQFRIIDTGIGMSKEFVNHLFDKFSQEDESVTRRFGGTGLGMSISKQLIELMGGHIQVDSKKNEGTSILFTLKFRKGKMEDLPRTDSRLIDSQILKGKQILLVEDNEMNLLLANTLLTQYGAKVEEALNGKAAIEKLEEKNIYDVVLMDVQMPVMGGLEATRYIRKSVDTNIPIIALTANAFEEEEQRCLESGMNDFISKPFDEYKFIKLVAQWMGRDVKGSAALDNEEEENIDLFDLTKLNKMSGGDKVFVNKMLNIFISTVPDLIEEMKTSFEKGELLTISGIAHRIKPAVNNLAITSIESEIRSLENIASIKDDKMMIAEQIHKVSTTVYLVAEQMKRLLAE